MPKIGENIKRLREEAGLSQEQLAEKLEKTRSAVSQYESGKIVPRMGVIEDLATIFDVSKSVIIGEQYMGKGFSPVPLYGRVAAGTPIEMLVAEDIKEAPAKFTDDDPDAYLVKVIGNSMSRRIQDGDFALVSPKYTEPNAHDMFLVTVNGDDATIKCVRVLENGIELIPDSYDPTYRPQVYDYNMDETPPIRIIGKIVWWCAGY